MSLRRKIYSREEPMLHAKLGRGGSYDVIFTHCYESDVFIDIARTFHRMFWLKILHKLLLPFLQDSPD